MTTDWLRPAFSSSTQSADHPQIHRFAKTFATAADARITAAYAGWAQKLVEQEGYRPFLMTLMFRPLAGSEASVAHQMERETERVYATLLKRVIRHPSRVSAISRRPIWFCCRDRPVFKHERQSKLMVLPNDGRHMHAVVLDPSWSRLREDLVTYFEWEAATYVRPSDPLDRIHVEAITHRLDNVVGYVRKQIGRDRAGEDISLILPRAHSELNLRNSEARHFTRKHDPLRIK